jgi:hypothetical protein
VLALSDQSTRTESGSGLKTTRPAAGTFTAAGRRYAVGIGLRRSLYVNGLCKPPTSSGVRQVFRAERPKPQPPHVIYYYHQNFSYMLDRPPFPCKQRINL